MSHGSSGMDCTGVAPARAEESIEGSESRAQASPPKDGTGIDLPVPGKSNRFMSRYVRKGTRVTNPANDSKESNERVDLRVGKHFPHQRECVAVDIERSGDRFSRDLHE